jgi:hypothetical protein
MKFALFQNAAPFEISDLRLARGFDATHESYYPEVVADGSSESVSVINREARTVQFELWAVARAGRHERLLHRGSIAPGAWRRLSVVDRSACSSFALVLKSDGPLSATFRLDDAAVGLSVPLRIEARQA